MTAFSDYLGNLWRRGDVSRLPNSAPGSKARWAYQWKDNPLASRSERSSQTIDYVPKLLVDRPTIVITEEGKTIQLQMPGLSILIKQTG